MCLPASEMNGPSLTRLMVIFRSQSTIAFDYPAANLAITPRKACGSSTDASTGCEDAKVVCCQKTLGVIHFRK